MVNADPEILRRDFPVSQALLVHGGLMTARLVRLFGPVHAVQTQLEVGDSTVTRWSQLLQTATGVELLRAKLVISVANLPPGFMDQLLSGNRLFGGLLIEAGVAVRMTDRDIYRTSADQNWHWGRRQTMLQASDGLRLAEVDECLSNEASLRRLLIAPLPDPE